MGSALTKHHNVVRIGRIKRLTLWKDLYEYLQQPIIYFCFALPLLAPSVFLVVLATVEGDIGGVFLILGWAMLSLAVICISIGSYLGCREIRKSNQFKDKKRLLKNDPHKSRRNSITPSCNTVSTNFSLTLPSANSSRRSSSSRSTSSTVSVFQPNDKSKLVGNKRRPPRRVQFPTDLLPSLQEEEHVRSLSRGAPTSEVNIPRELLFSANSRKRTSPGAGLGDTGMGVLKDYLQNLGLGSSRVQPSPSHSETPEERPRSRTAMTNYEKEMQTRNANTKRPISSRDNKPPKGPQSTAGPVLVASSHERTGISMPSHIS